MYKKLFLITVLKLSIFSVIVNAMEEMEKKERNGSIAIPQKRIINGKEYI
ncbi:MAG: hypothetical protein ACTSXG_03135 [Alphaproteobacteria bacterium]